MPLTLDFAKTAEERQVLEVMYSQEVFGRPYVLPPGTPPDRVAALRKAFMETMNDPALREDGTRVRLAVDPVAGDEIQALVTKILRLAAGDHRAPEAGAGDTAIVRRRPPIPTFPLKGGRSSPSFGLLPPPLRGRAGWGVRRPGNGA